MTSPDSCYILSLNSGSSSLKISLYSYHPSQTGNVSEPVSLKESLARNTNSINRNHITYICHRVVHGGGYKQSIIIDYESFHHIEALSDLAPLHNGAALSVIQACLNTLPDTKSIAYFDTTFHSTIPLHISSCAIDQKLPRSVASRNTAFMDLAPPEELNLILLHLGSGASVCAVKNGKSYDTSMGLTPLNGLPGATRSARSTPAGRITHDPSMAINVQVTMAEDILNRKSGWKSITGTTDFGVITTNAELDNPDPDSEIAARNPNRLAFDLFIDRILLYIGGYHLKLGGDVDALVFAGGIGERGIELRSLISERVACLGYCKLDEDLNKDARKREGVVVDISAEEKASRDVQGKRILMCKTDEQIEMARQCAFDPRFWEEKS
ncbi:acetate and butyrate kinase [Pholiota molesta]|nr:acetate and butyrate kinase [Pholiota molesta]